MSTLKLNQVVLGQSGTDTNNFLLDTDQAGALRIRRKSDGSGGTVLTVNAAGTLTQPAQSMVRLTGSNGFGSTNTGIWRFATVVTNQGADITYADSAANGGSFTVNTAGVYSFTYTNQFNAALWMGLSLNASGADLTTHIYQIAASKILAAVVTQASAAGATVNWTGYLAAGDVVRAHNATSLTAGTNTNAVNFTAVRIS